LNDWLSLPARHSLAFALPDSGSLCSALARSPSPPLMPTNTLPFTTSGAPVVVSPKRLDGKYLSGERAMIKATKSAR
jgi:hypothetical protein